MSTRSIKCRGSLRDPTQNMKAPKRRGATLLLVIISLIVLTTILAAMFRHLTISNRQIKQRNRKSQAILIAESAIDRAAVSLRNNPEYQQETWQITPDELGGRFGATVDIRILPNDDTQEQVIAVEAIYPVESDFRATVRKRVVVSRSEPIGKSPDGE